MKILNKLKNNKVLTFLLIIEIIIFVFNLASCFGSQDIVKVNSKKLESVLSAETAGKEQTVNLSPLSVKNTAYDVIIKYRSISDLSHPRDKSYKNITGNVVFSLNRQGLWSDPINLSDGTRVVKSRLWVQTGKPIDDLQVNVKYNGKGYLAIQSIALKECMIFRITKLIGIIVLSGIINLGYMFLCGRYFNTINLKQKLTIFALIAIIIFSSLLSMGNSIYNGDDLMFHLHRIVSLSDAIKMGNIPQRIQLTMIHGYGYASPLYYGEILLLIPALLYLLCIPLQMCYQIFVILVNAATCLLTFWCIKKITKSDIISVISAFLYTCSAYRLVNVYQRCAVGEYTAMIFLPLVVYGFYRLYTKEDTEKYHLKDYMPLVIGLTGVIQTHILSVEMTAILIFVFIVFHLRKTFKRNRFIALIKVVALTVLLNAWFLVPVLTSMHQNIRAFNMENHVGGWSIDPARMFSILDTGGGHHLTLGFVLLLSIILFIMIKFMRNRWQISDKVMKTLNGFYGLGILTILFTSPYFHWDNIYNFSHRLGKILATVQFSWRYFEFATVLLVFGLALSLAVVKENTNKNIYYSIAIGATAFTLLFASSFMPTIVLQGKTTDLGNQSSYYEYYMDNYEYTTADNSSYFEQISRGEYLPINLNPEILYNDKIIKSKNVKIFNYGKEGKKRQLSIYNGNATKVKVSIPLIYYDHYHAYLQNGRQIPMFNASGRVQLIIPAHYSGTVVVKYIEPIFWRISEGITLATVLFLIIYGGYKKLLNRSELKNYNKNM